MTNEGQSEQQPDPYAFDRHSQQKPQNNRDDNPSSPLRLSGVGLFPMNLVIRTGARLPVLLECFFLVQRNQVGQQTVAPGNPCREAPGKKDEACVTEKSFTVATNNQAASSLASPDRAWIPPSQKFLLSKAVA